MPNHFHCIVIIVGNGFKPFQNAWNDDLFYNDKNIDDDLIRNGFKPFPTEKTYWLSEIIRWFKTFSSRKINDIKTDFAFSWQKSFFDVIIKNEDQLNKTRQYIIDNPLKWEVDKNNPENIK